MWNEEGKSDKDVWKNQMETLKLLSSHIDVNRHTCFGGSCSYRPVLYLALQECSVEIVEVLLNCGADPDADDFCLTYDDVLAPLCYALDSIVDFQLSEKKQNKIVYALLQHGAKLNQLDRVGRSCLDMLFMWNFSEDVFRLCLSNAYDADVNFMNGFEESVLHFICRTYELSSAMSVIRVLVIDFFADVDLANMRDKTTALHAIIHKDNWPEPDPYCERFEAIEFLLTEGQANPNCQDINGDTPLHYVAKLCGDVETEWKQMAKSPFKQSSNHYNLWIESIQKIAKILINHGAATSAVNSKGHIPLEVYKRSTISTSDATVELEPLNKSEMCDILRN